MPYQEQGSVDPKRFLFVHIPKTAGTSFLATLSNAFGDSHVLRLRDQECDPVAIGHRLASSLPAEVRCIAGHFPIHAFASHGDGFRAFTILRDPIDRVMSLYRFLRRQSSDELARQGLSVGFGFDDFLASRSPELTVQVSNGMCRMLSGMPAANGRVDDHESGDGPGKRDRACEMAERAVATLRAIDFGLAEDMPGTLRLVRDMLDLPLDLAEHVENVSEPPGSEHSVRNIMRLVDLNAGDIALHREAKAMFGSRMERLDVSAHGSGERLANAGLLALGQRKPVSVRDIPGRQGFHGYEPDSGFAWLVGAGPARLAFAAVPGRMRVKLKIYHLTDAYPLGEIGLALNGASVGFRVERMFSRWVELQTDDVAIADRNLLTLTAPYCVPARFIDPASFDKRQLSIALSSLELAPS